MIDEELVRFMLPGAHVLSVDELNLRSVHTVPAELEAYRVTMYDRYGAAASIRERNTFYIIRNLFIATFFRHLANAVLYAHHKAKTLTGRSRIAARVVRRAMKRTQAECLYARRKGLYSIVSMIECLIEYERENAALYAWLDQHPEIKKAGLFAAEFAIDLVFQHEIAHCLYQYDRRFFDPVAEGIRDALASIDASDDPHLLEEIECDIFAINACFTDYSDRLSQASLRRQARSAVACQLAYAALLEDAEVFLAANETDYVRPPGGQEIEHHIQRYQVAIAYIDDFAFHGPAFVRNAKDEVSCADIDLNLITSGLRGLHDVRDDSSRQVAFLLANGYLSTDSHLFDVVVENASRTIWMEA
jgi:hypothetical protein